LVPAYLYEVKLYKEGDMNIGDKVNITDFSWNVTFNPKDPCRGAYNPGSLELSKRPKTVLRTDLPWHKQVYIGDINTNYPNDTLVEDDITGEITYICSKFLRGICPCCKRPL
jgi:hypothetical protein